jgi:hypothetical protein
VSLGASLASIRRCARHDCADLGVHACALGGPNGLPVPVYLCSFHHQVARDDGHLVDRSTGRPLPRTAAPARRQVPRAAERARAAATPTRSPNLDEAAMSRKPKTPPPAGHASWVDFCVTWFARHPWTTGRDFATAAPKAPKQTPRDALGARLVRATNPRTGIYHYAVPDETAPTPWHGWTAAEDEVGGDEPADVDETHRAVAAFDAVLEDLVEAGLLERAGAATEDGAGQVLGSDPGVVEQLLEGQDGGTAPSAGSEGEDVEPLHDETETRDPRPFAWIPLPSGGVALAGPRAADYAATGGDGEWWLYYSCGAVAAHDVALDEADARLTIWKAVLPRHPEVPAPPAVGSGSKPADAPLAPDSGPSSSTPTVHVWSTTPPVVVGWTEQRLQEEIDRATAERARLIGLAQRLRADAERADLEEQRLQARHDRLADALVALGALRALDDASAAA